MACRALPPAAALLAGVALAWAVPAPFGLTVLYATAGCGAAAICLQRAATRGFAGVVIAAYAMCGVALGSAARADWRTRLLVWYEACRAVGAGAVARPVVVEGVSPAMQSRPATGRA